LLGARTGDENDAFVPDLTALDARKEKKKRTKEEE